MFEKRNVQLVAFAAVFTLFAACGNDPEGGDDEELKFPDQQRSATLNFTTADDVFLVSVYSTPGIAEASPAADVLYDMAPAAATSGLRVSRIASAAKAPGLNLSYWNARLAVEKARRDGIERLADELEARGESLQLANPNALVAACSCTDTQTCASGSSACVDEVPLTFAGSSRTFQVVGTVNAGGVKVTVVTDAVAVAAALTSVAEEFANSAGFVLDVMGHSGHTDELDVDGTGSITVAFTNNFGSLPASTVGVFEFGDFLASGTAGATGNHADILWARVPGVGTPDELLIGTLAHEYQHLVSFALRSKLGDPTQLRETLWLDEGASHLMEDLTGWGGSTVDAYALGLEQWDNAPFAGPNDTVAQRGKAYMLLRYLVDAKARAAGATDAKSSQVKTAAHDVLAPLYTQKRVGFQHALFQDARNDGRIADWVRAVFTSGNTDIDAQPAAKQFLANTSSPNSNGQQIGFNPYGTYDTARGASVPLSGPGGVDDSNDAGFSAVSDSIPSSGARYYLVTGGTGNVKINLTADNATDINVDAVKVK
jgi:hypothetical protein